MGRKPPSPWLFLLPGLPYGIVGGFSTVIMGYLTRRVGLEIDAIGWFATLLFVPPMLHGGKTAATREPSGSRESRMGCSSEMSSPRTRAMFLTATRRLRSST